LATNGIAAIIEFPGVLYRSGAEQKIRKYLIDHNFIDTIIQLPSNLFFGTSIATCIIVLKKSKSEAKTLFVDASKEFITKTNSNELSEENVNNILKLVFDKKDVEKKCMLVDNNEIKNNDYNLSVSRYVKIAEEKEEIDIQVLNKQIDEVVAKINRLRKEIDEVIKEIE
jgi:type I restriction enzyme M protein